MGMSVKEVYDHFNKMNPQIEISRNTPDSTIMTVTYSIFKTICGLCDVKMAEFKRLAYTHFMEIAKIIGNRNLVIRLGMKTTFFEAYDVIFVNLDDDKIMQIHEIFTREGLIEQGFKLMVVNFIMPRTDEEKEANVEPRRHKTMMMRFCPPTEKPNEFFGYIL